MIKINKYLSDLKPYKVASHKVWRVPAQERKSLLKLDWNEATGELSPIVKKRLHDLLETDFLNLYPDTSNEELYRLLSKYLQLPEENIQYFGSSDSLHEYISRLYVCPEDEILILWPSYDNLRLTLQVSGARVKFFDLGQNFTFNPEAFEKAIEDNNPKMVYICNPNNPTGTILKKEYIHHLVKKFPQVIFLIDEAYIEFCAHETCKNYVLEFDNLLITRTMSKAFGLAAIRFGYLIASRENIVAISNIRNPKNITIFAQEAAIGALSDVSYMEAYVEEVKKARSYFIDAVNSTFEGKVKAYQSFGNFVMLNCYDYQRKLDLLAYLEQNNVFIRAVGQSESLRNCVRVTIGNIDQMKHVVRLMDQFFK